MRPHHQLRQIALLLFITSSIGVTGCAEDASSFNPANGQAIMAQATCGEQPQTCPGTPLPAVELEEFQPQSPNVGTPVNLTSFQGRPLLVALLASW